MPTPRKSAQRVALADTARADRPRGPKPEPAALGKAPEHLDERHAGLWRELAAACPVGGKADRLAFELLVVLVAKLRSNQLKAAEVSQLVRMFEGFAMLPSARAKLPDLAPPAQPVDPRKGFAFDA